MKQSNSQDALKRCEREQFAPGDEEHGRMSMEEEEEFGEEEEFSTWKKNTPLLYDVVISEDLEWPSLTVQWLPCRQESSSYVIEKLILGTHTSNEEPNHLMIAEVHLPSEIPEPLPTATVDPPTLRATVEIVQKITHEGEVNRARCMPQKPSLIGTKTVSSDVYVFDCEKHPSEPADAMACNPDLILKGHTDEGYGLSWSPMKEGYLLSGSHDKVICLWDINSSCENKILEAKQVFQAHKSAVEDVTWHLKNENIFGSVGDDCLLLIWDMRAAESHKPQQSTIAHKNEVNSLSFHPVNEWLLATCSSDKTVKLFDLRKLSCSLHTFSNHMEGVFQVAWSPFNETILASSGADKNIMVWDLNRIGEEQTAEEAEDGPPELLFIHGGHTDKVSDFSWNPNDDRVIASVAEDNVLQIWQFSETSYKEEEDPT
eukprot:TRINITY_DN6926_c0_g1_i1.p1 TRINITY_DN6926_c0_g1~~TRINITY_DN6926_c0_g1_i1.p1  ORF type:complete len:429 (+),score=97.16 TRINITY_DN6926_c0_g1_i1:23-1309(+)